MKLLIINADDFGYSPGVNSGIIYSHQHGILTSATLMANMPGTQEAVALAKQHPGLGIGAHLTLTAGRPVIKELGTLTDDDGNFFKLPSYHEKRPLYREEEIFIEWCAQIDYLMRQGLTLTHLDSHHHVHSFPENQLIARAVSERYGLPFRNSRGAEKKAVVPANYRNDICVDMMNTEMIRSLDRAYVMDKEACLAELSQTFNAIADHEIVEAMVHPAFVDETLYYQSSFHLQRMREVEILVASEVRNMLDMLGYQFVHYGFF